MKKLLVAAFIIASCSPNATTPTGSAALSPIPSPTPTPSFETSAAPGTTVTPTSTASVVPGGRPTAVRFLDRDHGWLGLDDGILGTPDAGTTWTRQLDGVGVTRIWALDAKHAWAETASKDLYRTEDGSTWKSTGRRDALFDELQFVSPAAGWAIVDDAPQAPVGRPAQLGGSLFQSTDGGLTWLRLGDRSLRSMCFVDEQKGWAADAKQIFKTTDGGKTWVQIADLAIKDDGPWYPTIRCGDMTNARVQISEPGAAMSHAPYLMFRTNDGGSTWALEYREGYTLGSTTPSGTPQLGSYPSTFETLPDGNTWVVTCTPPVDKQMFLVLSPTGSVIGRGEVPFASCANDATFIDSAHGWVIGPVFIAAGTASGVIRTVDGARSWERVYPR